MLETMGPIPPELVELIERTVRAAVGRFGLRSVEVRAGADHDGDPSIFIEAVHDLSETPIDPEINSKLSMDLWLMLLDAGETRFPYVQYKYHELQTVKGYPTAKRRRRSMP
jgi:hypothetical protein